jgi:flavin reductase (DIM6/NTAB) family NADH-FMN oxidoreductase RutF
MVMETRSAVRFEPKHYRSVMAQFATGVTIITYEFEGRSVGMTANAFMSISIDPPLVLVSVKGTSRFLAALHVTSRFGISFLGEQQQHLSAHFGGKSIDGFQTEFRFYEGVPLIAGSLAYVVAHANQMHEAGDHILVIGAIEHMYLGEPSRPLVFYGGKYKQILGHDPTFGWHTSDGW